MKTPNRQAGNVACSFSDKDCRYCSILRIVFVGKNNVDHVLMKVPNSAVVHVIVKL